MKIIASDFPASGFLSYLPPRMRSASSKSATISSLEKSGIWRKSRWSIHCSRRLLRRRSVLGGRALRDRWSQNVATQVLVLDDRLEAIPHGVAVHHDRAAVVALPVGQLEQRVLEQRGHHGVLANWVASSPTPMPGNYSALGGYGMNPYDPRPDPRPGFN